MKKIIMFMVVLVTSFTVAYTSPLISVNEKCQSKDDVGKTVTLVVSGNGITKEEATKVALRAALEQAFGTFVSANTKVVNDELIKDEIVSISSGNIKKYNVISCIELPDGLYDVSVKAEVSIGNLVRFAQSHGMSTELSGNTFLMNRNIAKLNKINEIKALNDLAQKLLIIFSKGLYDFSIDVGDPKGGGPYNVLVTIKATPNENMSRFWSLLEESLNNISMSEEECHNYRKLSMEVFDCGKIKELKKEHLLKNNVGIYHFRNYYGSFIGWLELILESAKFCYEVYDNLGTEIKPILIQYANITEQAKAKGLFYEWHGYDLYFGIMLNSVPLTNPNSNVEVLKNYWDNKNYFEIVYTEARLNSLKNISIKPYLIDVSE